MIYKNQVITMICRALNLMDSRLLNHGVQVAAVMRDMLEAAGVQDLQLKKNLCLLALFHDVGAYHLQDIDNLVQVETKSAEEHSIYGYLFLREFSPFGALAKVVLYHHRNVEQMTGDSEEILEYAQLLHVADRVEIWHRSYKGKNEDGLLSYLQKKSGTLFAEDAVESFLSANEQFSTYEKLSEPLAFDQVLDCSTIGEEEIQSYLWLLVHAIDFRSHFTVTHTVSVTEIACQLANKMGLSAKEQEEIYYGALLHDVGKIGTPVSILEKDGRLTEEEMKIMREHIILSGKIIEGCVSERVAHIALRHHEKLNGSGYPLGLTGEEMTLAEKIMTVADIVSALSMKRSYKEAFPKEQVFQILYGMAERQELEPKILEVLEDNYDEIIERARRVCIPIHEAHQRISRDYQAMLCGGKEQFAWKI